MLMFCSCDNDIVSDALVLNRGINSSPDSLDPHEYSGNDAATILFDIGEGLLTLNASGDLIGGIANRWEISDDGLRYIFFLRSGLMWSDGSALDAKDVVRSFRRLVDPRTASPNSHNAVPIKNATKILNNVLQPDALGIRAADSQTVEIELEHPTPYFLHVLAHPSLQPRHSSLKDDSEKLGPVSNGAYRLVASVVGSSFRLERNNYYWGVRDVDIDEVVYHVIGQDIEPIRFAAGELDITDNVSEFYFEKYKNDSKGVLQVAPMLGIYYLGFNLDARPFRKNPKFRHALSLAIDREILVEKVLGRGEIPAFRFVPPGVANYPNVAHTSHGQSERERAAKSLIKEAGIENPSQLQVELRYNTGGGHERIATAIASMWRDVLGIQVQLAGEEFRVFIQNVRNGLETELFRLSWVGDYNDPYTFLQVFESGNSSNLTGFSNPIYDELIKQANLASDPHQRQMLLVEAEELVLESAPVIPLYFYVSKHLVSDRVTGWLPNVLDIHKSQYLSIPPSS